MCNDTQRKIEVMQAHLAGKTIQVRNVGANKWEDCVGGPHWNWATREYRVKPEPMVRYGVTHKDGSWYTSYPDFIPAMKAAEQRGGRVIKMVEEV